MGNYVPQNPRRKRSVREALLEAEEDHYLDCPNADALIRLAAFVVDSMFLFLVVTSISRIFRAIAYPTAGLAEVSFQIRVLLYSSETALQALAFYLMEVETLVRFGGTPGKMLTGLRVIDATTGAKLTFVQAILREVLLKWALGLATFGLSLVYTLARKDHRALHDVATRSTVKKVHFGGS
jgi:uncharacterized RDD family membrane protein YckC